MSEFFQHGPQLGNQFDEDRVLRALVRKTDTIKRELGSLSQVIEGRLAGTLERGIRHRDVEWLEREIDSADLDGGFKETVEEELEAARERQGELREQQERLQDLLLKHAKADSQEIIARTMEAVNEWTGSSELQDDMTMVVARRL